MGPNIKGCIVQVGDSEGYFKEAGKAQEINFKEKKPININFNIDIKGPQEIIEEVENSMPYIGQDFHLYDAESVARKIAEIKEQHMNSRCMIKPIFKEDKNMYKNDLDLLTEKGQNKPMYVTMEHYSERGFGLYIEFNDGTIKKEFVEYGENVGEHINDLIHDFIEDIADKQREQEEIEYLEEQLERDKRRIEDLKENK